MQFDELLVTTGVDALVKLIREKQKIELPIAAQLLNIDASTIEEWSHILEDEGIIKLEYHLTKVYLEWVTPKPEEVKKERESFYEQKQTVQQEISGLETHLRPRFEEVIDLKKGFDEAYNKIKPKMNEIEADLKQLKSMKGSVGEKFTDNLQKMDELRAKAGSIGEDLKTLKSELTDIKKDLGTKAAPAKKKFEEMPKIKSYVDDLKTQLAELDKKIEKAVKGTPQKPDSFKKEVSDLSSELWKLKDALKTVTQNVETFKEIDKSVEERQSRLVAFKDEIESLYDTIEQIKVRSSLISEKIKNDLEFLESADATMASTKGSAVTIPNKEEVLKKLSLLEGRLKALETGISQTGDPGYVLNQLKSLRQDLENRKAGLEVEVEDLINAIEEESATYSTFQKIKEKALQSIEQYTAEFDNLSKDYKKLSEETNVLGDSIDKSFEKLKLKSDQKSFQQLIESMNSIVEKKRILDEVAGSLGGLSVNADSLARKINLLSKEAKILELRAGSHVPGEQIDQKREELRTQLTLTDKERIEFDRKREELRDLIKKLWEQS
ncbi:hypothetical protein HYT84_04105 [Candidatus Micrarchaeota archaeon]|nr:hypothetical protein [Candidatus Micrarchaeota archaeon]